MSILSLPGKVYLDGRAPRSTSALSGNADDTCELSMSRRD